MSFWNTVKAQLYLFIPESRKVMKSRERLQTLPSPTRPMHFGSRGPSHQRNALTKKAWEKRRTGTKQGKPCILNGLRDCVIIIKRKAVNWAILRCAPANNGKQALTPLLVTKKVITNPSIDLHEFTRLGLYCCSTKPNSPIAHRPLSCPVNHWIAAPSHLRAYLWFMQGQPMTVFCKISVPRSKNYLESSIAWGRLKISRWPFHSCSILKLIL